MTLEPSDLNQTALHNLHVELGAKMVPFAGYQMPVQFPTGIIKEHLHTRNQAGLFDVSHMGQLVVEGSCAVTFLEKLLPLDIESMAIGQQGYTVMLNEAGGILDDLIVTRWSEKQFFLVVNAACKAQDIRHIESQLDDGVELTELVDRALLALQGPAAVAVIAELVPRVKDLVFMTGTSAQLQSVDCYITRSGYTGEDGFEISLPSHAAEPIARQLLRDEAVQSVGLGARDSLRLEAGLCLYGHDMNDETSPVEAGLNFAIAKARRAEGVKAGGFIGAERVLRDMESGVKRKRVGFLVEGRAPVREGAVIEDLAGNEVGIVTSGGFAASVDAPVAMGYVDIEHGPAGTSLQAIVRGKPKPIRVVKTPFVPQRYYRG